MIFKEIRTDHGTGILRDLFLHLVTVTTPPSLMVCIFRLQLFVTQFRQWKWTFHLVLYVGIIDFRILTVFVSANNRALHHSTANDKNLPDNHTTLEGFSPTEPLWLAGIRIDPPPSLRLNWWNSACYHSCCSTAASSSIPLRIHRISNGGHGEGITTVLNPNSEYLYAP